MLHLIGAFLLLQLLVHISIALAILTHGFILKRYERYTGPRLARARLLLSVLLTEGTISPQERSWLNQLRYDLLLRVLIDVSPSLQGEERQRVLALGTAAGLIARAERSCRSRFWWKRLAGLRLFTLLGGGESVVPALLLDPNLYVRAQAIEWAGDHPSEPSIGILLSILSQGETALRFAIQGALLRMGEQAIPELSAFIASHDGIAAQRALEVAIGLPDSVFIDPALRLCSDANPQNRALAIALLGDLGGLWAETAAFSALDDPDAAVRSAALACLAQMGLWRAAPTVAQLLSDRSWPVRRAAARALLAFGPPGRILLQRTLRLDESVAVEMAQHAIDLAEAQLKEGRP